MLYMIQLLLSDNNRSISAGLTFIKAETSNGNEYIQKYLIKNRGIPLLISLSRDKRYTEDCIQILLGLSLDPNYKISLISQACQSLCFSFLIEGFENNKDNQIICDDYAVLFQKLSNSDISLKEAKKLKELLNHLLEKAIFQKNEFFVRNAKSILENLDLHNEK